MRNLRENGGRYLLCTLLMAVGLGAFVIKSWIDVQFWVSQAVTPEGKWQFGGAALVFCSASMIFACAIAARFRQKVTLWGVLGTVMTGAVLAYVTVYGMASIVGFGARERINPYATAQAKIAAEKVAAEETNSLRQKYIDKQLAFLQEQARATKGPKARQAAYNASGDLFGSIEIKPEPVQTEQPDPQAVALHKIFPQYSVEDIQNIWVAAFGIGLLVVELFGMGLGVGMWPKPLTAAQAFPEIRKEEPLADDDSTEVAPVKSAVIIHPPQFSKPAQASIVEEPVEATAAEEAQGELLREVDEHMSQMEGITAFWEQGTRPAKAARIGASAMYRAYQEWCEERDLLPVTQRKFGRESNILGVEKDTTSNKGWFYIGRAVIQDNGDGEPELLMAA